MPAPGVWPSGTRGLPQARAAMHPLCFPAQLHPMCFCLQLPGQWHDLERNAFAKCRSSCYTCVSAAQQSWVWKCNGACFSRGPLRVCPLRIHLNTNQQIETWIFNFWQPGSHQRVNLVVYPSTFSPSQFGQIMPRFLTNTWKSLTNCLPGRRRYFGFCNRRNLFAALTVNKMLSLICRSQEPGSAQNPTRIQWIETRKG